ncbi:MAG: amidohydrolase family protein [bacterium]|nr:amidohydrolase family protein [bacterium]
MSRHISFAVLVVCLISGCLAADDDLVVRGGRLFDGTSDTLVDNPGIHVENGRIVRIGGEAPAAAHELTLKDDDTILPGFFDLHAHFNMTLVDKRRDEVDVMPLIYLANGATSVFPCGEFDPVAMLGARRAIDRGDKVGPRIYNSGPYFGPARPGWKADVSAQKIRDEVDYWAEQGVRGLKVKRISASHLEVLLERAHAHGLTVTGHLDSGFNDTVNPRDAILMGIDRVEHFLGGDAITADRPAYDSLLHVTPDTPEFARIVDLFLQRRVYFDATLSAYGYFGERGPVYEKWTDERRFFTPYTREVTEGRSQRIEKFGTVYQVKRRTLKAFFDAGGGDLITLGTDHNSWGEFLPGFSVHREMHAMVLAGIPAAEVLRIATINGARALGLGDRLGTIEPGKWADLVVVRGDPLDDIRRTRTVHTVVKGGDVFVTADLLRQAEGRLGPADANAAGDW